MHFLRGIGLTLCRFSIDVKVNTAKCPIVGYVSLRARVEEGRLALWK